MQNKHTNIQQELELTFFILVVNESNQKHQTILIYEIKI